MDEVLFSVVDTVAHIVLNRPNRRNALDAGMRRALATQFERIESADDIRAVLITGSGTVFCGGQDLDEPCMEPRTGGKSLVSKLLHEQYHPLLRRIYQCSKPTVCAVNGAAIGGGANIALACDIVIAARSACFIQPYVNLGLTLDAGASFHLVHRIGHARAMGLALLGDSLDAETAASWGLIWRVVPDECLSAEAGKVAQHLAKGPAAAMEAIKISIRAACTNSFEGQLDDERNLQRWVSGDPEYAERMRAFKERKKPQH